MGQEISLYPRISLKLPPPLKKPIIPKMKNIAIGISTSHSRISRLIENHSFFAIAKIGFPTVLLTLLFCFFFFLLLPSLILIQPVRNPFSTNEIVAMTLITANSTNIINRSKKLIDPFADSTNEVPPQLKGTHFGNNGIFVKNASVIGSSFIKLGNINIK